MIIFNIPKKYNVSATITHGGYGNKYKEYGDEYGDYTRTRVPRRDIERDCFEVEYGNAILLIRPNINFDDKIKIIGSIENAAVGLAMVLSGAVISKEAAEDSSDIIRSIFEFDEQNRITDCLLNENETNNLKEIKELMIAYNYALKTTRQFK